MVLVASLWSLQVLASPATAYRAIFVPYKIFLSNDLVVGWTRCVGKIFSRADLCIYGYRWASWTLRRVRCKNTLSINSLFESGVRSFTSLDKAPGVRPWRQAECISEDTRKSSQVSHMFPPIIWTLEALRSPKIHTCQYSAHRLGD